MCVCKVDLEATMEKFMDLGLDRNKAFELAMNILSMDNASMKQSLDLLDMYHKGLMMYLFGGVPITQCLIDGTSELYAVFEEFVEYLEGENAGR